MIAEIDPDADELWRKVQVPTLDAIARIYNYKYELSEKLVVADERIVKHGYKVLFDAPPSGSRASLCRHDNLNGLKDLHSYVKLHPNIVWKFLFPEDRESDPLDASKVLLHEISMIPVLLAARYVAAHPIESNINVPHLEDLFADQKGYLLSDDLRMDVYIPILGAKVAAEGDFGDYSIVELSDSRRAFLANVSHVSARDKNKLSGATHALKMSNVRASAGGYGSYFELVPYFSTIDAIDRFFEAVSIGNSSAVGYAQMLLEPIGWFGNMDSDGNTSSIYLLRDHATRLDNYCKHVSEISVDQLSRANLHFNKLGSSHPSLRVAARRYVAAWNRESDEDRIVDLCIGLEALLGSGSGSGEIVHKISLRAAAMLSRIGWGPSGETLSSVKDIYSYRSRVVHGVPGPHKKQLLHLEDMPIHATRLAMAILSNILQIALAMEKFNPDKVDEMFVYSALDASADTA